MTNNAWNTPTSTANGQLLIAQASGSPAWGTVTQGSGSTVTNGAGSITVAFDAASSDFVLISSSTASSSSEITFTGLSSTYNTYMISMQGVVPGTDNVALYFQTSTDNGSTYDSGASDYQWNYNVWSSGVGDNEGDTSDSKIAIAGQSSGEELGTAAGETLSGTIFIFNPSATTYTKFISTGNYHDDTTSISGYTGGGFRESAADVDAVRLYMSSGNIASGTFKLYGMNA